MTDLGADLAGRRQGNKARDVAGRAGGKDQATGWAQSGFQGLGRGGGGEAGCKNPHSQWGIKTHPPHPTPKKKHQGGEAGKKLLEGGWVGEWVEAEEPPYLIYNLWGKRKPCT